MQGFGSAPESARSGGGAVATERLPLKVFDNMIRNLLDSWLDSKGVATERLPLKVFDNMIRNLLDHIVENLKW